MTEPTATPTPMVPFDIKVLISKLETAGIPVAKDAGHLIVNSVFEWIEESVTASPSKIDDFALAVLPPFKAFIDAKIDAIK